MCDFPRPLDFDFFVGPPENILQAHCNTRIMLDNFLSEEGSSQNQLKKLPNTIKRIKLTGQYCGELQYVGLQTQNTQSCW